MADDLTFKNPVLHDFLFGSGTLFVITATIKSPSITVSFEKSSSVAAQVDVPVIQQIVGGKIKVTTESSSSHVVTFAGQTPLVFGFECLRMVVDDGVVKLSIKTGPAFLSAQTQGPVGAILREEEGLLEF
jgi:hypothetical protein